MRHLSSKREHGVSLCHRMLAKRSGDDDHMGDRPTHCEVCEAEWPWPVWRARGYERSDDAPLNFRLRMGPLAPSIPHRLNRVPPQMAGSYRHLREGGGARHQVPSRRAQALRRRLCRQRLYSHICAAEEGCARADTLRQVRGRRRRAAGRKLGVRHRRRFGHSCWKLRQRAAGGGPQVRQLKGAAPHPGAAGRGARRENKKRTFLHPRKCDPVAGWSSCRLLPSRASGAACCAFARRAHRSAPCETM